MAKILVLDKQGSQVGFADFVLQEGGGTYLYVSMDANLGAQYELSDSTLFDRKGHPMATLWCGSDGQIAYAQVSRFGRGLPYWGIVKGSRVEINDGYQMRSIGSVQGKSIYSDNQGIVGEMSMSWSSADEAYYNRRIQDYAVQARIPAERAKERLSMLRPVLYQTMMNIAGGASLIAIFEKRQGWRYWNMTPGISVIEFASQEMNSSSTSVF